MIYIAKFSGYWPVGAGAVVEAEDENAAYDLMTEQLIQMNLTPSEQDLTIEPFNGPVHVVCDGDY